MSFDAAVKSGKNLEVHTDYAIIPVSVMAKLNIKKNKKG